MTPKVLEVREHWSISRLTEFFVENSISGAPVTTEDGKLIGVVSLTDIVIQNTLPEKDAQSYTSHGYYLQTLEHRYGKEDLSSLHVQDEPVIAVHDIMTPLIFKVTEETPIQEVADTMIKNCIHRVFVTRKEKVVGIISSVDMLKVVRDI